MQVDVIGRLVEGSTAAHEGLTHGESVWGAWHLDLLVMVPLLVLVGLYLRGLERWQDRSREHPWWRTASYLSGVAILAVAVQSPLDALAEHHFSMHMIQHEVLMMFAAPLVLLGAPTTPLLRGLPRGVRRRLVRPVASSRAWYLAYRFVTHPVVVFVLFTGTLWAWHLVPGWYDAALEHEWLHSMQHLSFWAIGVLVFWNVIDPKPLRSRLSYIWRMALLIAVSTPKSFLGAFLLFAEEPLYDFYLRVEPVLSVEPLDDQQLGALIMWVPSQMMFLLAAGVVFGVWAHKAEQRQREEDDARIAAQREAQAAAGSDV